MNININEKYKIENIKLGEGAFSQVFLGSPITDTESDHYIAIKRVSLSQDKILDKLVVEIEVMQKINHPNIVKYHDVVKTNDYWYIIMEYCDAGTLKDVIGYNKKYDISLDNSCEINNIYDKEANTFYYMLQVKNAMQYIRSIGYIHRDIKPMNILLTRSNIIQNNNDLLFEADFDVKYNKQEDWDKSQKLIVKVADFGLARYHDTNDTMINTICGSPLYMAPELLIDMKYNSKVDLWAYGIILYEMLFGEFPINGCSLQQLRMHLKQKKIDFHLNKNFTPECFDLLVKLLDKDHETRINWEYFFDHEWFKYWENGGQSLTNSISKPILQQGSNLTKMSPYSYSPCNSFNTPPTDLLKRQSSSPYTKFRYSPNYISPSKNLATTQSIKIDHHYIDNQSVTIDSESKKIDHKTKPIGIPQKTYYQSAKSFLGWT